MDPTNKGNSPSNKSIDRLDGSLVKILQHEACTEEVRYRLQKLRDCMGIAEDKFFIGTPKAREQIEWCVDIADRLLVRICSESNDRFAIITELEVTLNDLLKKTYEFRIKAG